MSAKASVQRERKRVNGKRGKGQTKLRSLTASLEEKNNGGIKEEGRKKCETETFFRDSPTHMATEGRELLPTLPLHISLSRREKRTRSVKGWSLKGKKKLQIHTLHSAAKGRRERGMLE